MTPAERTFQEFLASAVELATYGPDDGDRDGLPESDPDQQVSIRTFEEAGLLTNNAGLVVSYGDGDQFQVTIVQSATGRGRADGPASPPLPADPARAVVYCRVSTDEQGDSGLGLEATCRR